MNRIRPPRHLAILALLPVFAFVFWMTALLASNLAGLLIVSVNVHGLSLASYAGDAGPRPAPLSLRIIEDARQDAGSVAIASRVLTTPGAAPSGSGQPPAPSLPTPTPRPTPTSAPTLPVPTPTLPVPTPTPLPTLPVPTPTPLPLPVPSVPLPTPTPTPTPLLPLPLPLPLPILPSVLPILK